MVIVCKLIGITWLLIHQNEENKQHFALIRWLYHLGGGTLDSMTKTANIGQNGLSNAPIRLFFPDFFLTYRIFEISESNCIRKMWGAKLWDNFFLMSHPISSWVGFPRCRGEHGSLRFISIPTTFAADYNLAHHRAHYHLTFCYYAHMRWESGVLLCALFYKQNLNKSRGH